MSDFDFLVDSHVNLHATQYEPHEIDGLVADALGANVRAMLTICDRLDHVEVIKAICARYPFVWRSVGVHPHYADDFSSLNAQALIEAAGAPDVVGIGECGLDFYYGHSGEANQRHVFAAHIKAAQATGLPLIIHTRDADEMMLEMLEAAMAEAPFVPLLHCYTSGEALAARVYDWGGYISFSGIATFKNADAVRAIAASAPIDRLIIETDCPYLAPVPKRGRRNEPALLVHVAAFMAELRGMPLADFTTQTTQNFFRLFQRADAGLVPASQGGGFEPKRPSSADGPVSS
ncbi:MAG: TatD family hydrolase [Pseudomonadota bacterium]